MAQGGDCGCGDEVQVVIEPRHDFSHALFGLVWLIMSRQHVSHQHAGDRWRSPMMRQVQLFSDLDPSSLDLVHRPSHIHNIFHFVPEGEYLQNRTAAYVVLDSSLMQQSFVSGNSIVQAASRKHPRAVCAIQCV